MGRGPPEELYIGRDETPQEICRFSSVRDVAFRQICEKINGSSGQFPLVP